LARRESLARSYEAVIVADDNSLSMKPWYIWGCAAVLSISTAPAGAQGEVEFRNSQPDFPTPRDRDVYNVDTFTPLVGTNFQARLLYGTDAANLQPATYATPARFRNVTAGVALAGTWSGSASRRILNGFPPGSTATLVVQVWEAGPDAGPGGVPGRTFEQARGGLGLWGESSPFTYTVPATDAPFTAYYMDNFIAFAIGGCRGTIRITQPTNGTILLAPASISFEAERISSPATITNVAYYCCGSQLLGSSVTPPYTFLATNLPANDYQFQAVAQADSGEVCSSDPVSVRVMVPPAPPNVQVSPRIILRGSTATLTASTIASPPLSYYWYFLNTLLSGGSSNSVAITNPMDGTDGAYTVVASNAVGVSTSAPISLTVRSVLVTLDGQPVQSPAYTSSVPVMVQLETFYPRGTIFYTLNGSTPDYASPQYTGPFTVDHSVRLRAIGYSADFFEFGAAEPVDISLPPLRFLSVTSTGGGGVQLDPNSSTFRHGETVRLTAQPSNGWSFLEWRGDASGSNPEISAVMDSDRCVRALFGTTLTTTAAGGGHVLLDPPGGVYPYGTVVRLYAVPATNNYFVLWGNYASGSSNPLDFPVVDPAPAISSAFSLLSPNHVTLSAVPDGFGYIDVVPRTNRYLRGQTVQLRAQGSFVHWSGDVNGSDGTAALVLDTSKTVTAHFDKRPRLISDPCHIGHNSEGFYATLWGVWGERYSIDFSDLPGNWQPLTTFTNKYGTTQFTDPAATNVTHRSYRAKLAEP
jgi:hypothetical protein